MVVSGCTVQDGCTHLPQPLLFLHGDADRPLLLHLSRLVTVVRAMLCDS